MRDLLDFKIYLDISDDVKFAWKLQRDMAERGHSEESIKQSISARKPDFDAYIDPQKKHADVILQVMPLQQVSIVASAPGSPPSSMPLGWHATAHTQVHSPSQLGQNSTPRSSTQMAYFK